MTALPPLPERALSIRQPWAWAILNAGKDIENRPRRYHYRGPICIHASLAMTDKDYDPFSDLVKEHFPDNCSRWITQFCNGGDARGGIIGTAEILDCIETSDSPWFFGPYGLVLRNVQPVPFIPVKGALGLFRWRKNLERRAG